MTKFYLCPYLYVSILITSIPTEEVLIWNQVCSQKELNSIKYGTQISEIPHMVGGTLIIFCLTCSELTSLIIILNWRENWQLNLQNISLLCEDKQPHHNLNKQTKRKNGDIN